MLIKDLTLYGARTGNSIRASIALEESGLRYSAETIALRRGEHKQEPFLSINRLGQVPALVITGEDGEKSIITQSNAIMLFAAENANGASLLGTTSLARAKVFERYFYFVTDVVVPSNTGFRLKGAAYTDAAQYLDIASIRNLMYANTFLQEHSYVAGDDFSIADIAAFTISLAYHNEIDWASLPELSEWFERVSKREAVKRGLTAFR